MRILEAIGRYTARLFFALLMGGLVGGALARYSAGFGVDERELDNHLGNVTIEQIRAERSEGTHFVQFYVSFLSGIAHGNLGYSTTLNRPIQELLKERLPRTVREMLIGLISAGLLSSLLAIFTRVRGCEFMKTPIDLVSNLSLCLPVAILGYLSVFLRLNPCWALAVCVFPHLFRYTASLFESAALNGFVLGARSRGTGPLRLEAMHVVLPCIPNLLAISGMAVSIAFGALIPLEFATETPGMGQLAWQAASSRDMPLLCILTMITAVLVLGANCIGDLLQLGFHKSGDA